ncbi:uncharacterized protein [Apostichopus japonicus]|uniref:uncharacterized protein isoform X4 n=1 Tax=Stichopus japonicus TaxID=307972 RepID=UPI003AB51C60
MERRGHIYLFGTIAVSPIQIMFFLLNLANLFMLCFGEETIVFDQVWKQHIIRSEGQTVTLRCISNGNVTISRTETLKNDSQAKIVMNSTLLGNYTGSYIFNSTKNGSDIINDLTIRDVTREFNGSLFRCVDHVTFNSVELTLMVLYSPRREYPQCASSSTYPIYFTDQIGEPFDIICISEEGNHSINLALQNTLTLINGSSVTLGENKTHRYVELNAKLDSKWNNSMFYCYVVQSFPGMVNYSANCSFGPIQFVDELTIITNTSNVSFKEGKKIMFSCKSNVDAAYKQWIIIYIPKHVSYSSSNDSDYIYLEMDVSNLTKDTLITLACFVSYRGRNLTTNVTAYVETSGSEVVFKLPILALIVFLIVLLLVIAKACGRQLHCEARGYRERTRDLRTVNKTETQTRRNEENIPVTSQQTQRSVLPNLPDEINTSQDEREIETYYSTVTTDTSGSNRLFNEDDICLMLKMKTGTLYTRWMGTIPVSLGVTKCVVLTTLSDERVVKHRDIHWDKFVKTSLDLPVTNQVTKIEGIGIVYNQINMITEHLACKTLDNYLNFDPTSRQGSGRSVTSVRDVMEHLSGLLEGMEVIKSYGFLHPCFSTKKILYTKQGQCKLYDFCLAEDAPTICAIKKSEMKSVTLNQFAPEAFDRNEYSAESDVWSTAVVIWEIISAGYKPFPINEEYKPGDVIPMPKTPWPEKYLQLRNTLLFECWSENMSLRPSIHHLKDSFKTIFDKLIDNSFYEIPVSSLYTRMISPTDD